MVMPLAVNSTEVTVPSASFAIAETVTGVPADTLAPLAGLVRLTEGGELTETVTNTELEVVVLFELSVATAVRA